MIWNFSRKSYKRKTNINKKKIIFNIFLKKKILKKISNKHKNLINYKNGNKK